MILLRERIAELLARQDIGKQVVWGTLEPEWQAEYLKNADEIIVLFTNSIKNLEFKTSSSVPDGK